MEGGLYIITTYEQAATKSPGSRVYQFVLNLVCPGGHVSRTFRLPGRTGLAHQHTGVVAHLRSIGSITLQAITHAPG